MSATLSQIVCSAKFLLNHSLSPWSATISQDPKANSIGGFQTSPLKVLPSEVFSTIADYLSLPSTACLMLTCHTLFTYLGPKRLENLRLHPELDEFLELLSRDTLDYVKCCHCKRLHSIIFIHRYIPATNGRGDYNRESPCRLDDQTRWVTHYIHENFSSTAFRMIMKRHRQGRVVEIPQGLFSSKPKILKWQEFNAWSRAWHLIADDSLLVRTQYVFLLHHGSMVPFWNGKLGLVMCPHNMWLCAERQSSAGKSLRNHVARWIENDSYISDHFIQCEYCLTELKVDLKRLDYDVGIFITKWQDLGSGISHLDYKWQSHIDGQLHVQKRIEFKEGEISTAFEKGQEFDPGSLLDGEDWQKLQRRYT